MKRFLQFAAGLSLSVALPVLALGNADAGQVKAAMCAACHGTDGNSVIPNWPKLAGQHAAYLERQLGLIKSGSRPVPEMVGIVASLSEQDMADLAAYFSSRTITAGLSDKALQVTGQKLYRAGDAEKDVPACMSCHGPAGEGNPFAGHPSLGGQHSVYTEKMLKDFRTGIMWNEYNSPSMTMTVVTKRLTDAEIKAVASYIQGLHPVGATTE